MEPFTIAVADSALADLADRLEATRWPGEIAGAGWSYGTDQAYLRDVVEHWRHRYDWRATEAELNRWPQFVTEAAGERVHGIHARSPVADATPLVLTHGWPGSIVEFLDCLGPLTDPAAHGGDPADAFHVVVVSMPGFGFSGPTRSSGVDVHRVADAVAEVMTQLGYERFIAQGGDWGALVTRRLGEAHADRTIAIHCNMLFAFPTPDDDDPMAGVTDEETESFARASERISDGMGYLQIQSTRPHSLGFGLEDSPVGLAGWILEKFHAWCDTRDGMPISVDRLLDNIMFYWLTATATSAARLYAESARAGTAATEATSARVEVPTGHTVYPGELLVTPRAWAERRYNIVYWNTQPRGGHFAAFEQPELFVNDLRAFARRVRDGA